MQSCQRSDRVIPRRSRLALLVVAALGVTPWLSVRALAQAQQPTVGAVVQRLWVSNPALGEVSRTCGDTVRTGPDAHMHLACGEENLTCALLAQGAFDVTSDTQFVLICNDTGDFQMAGRVIVTLSTGRVIADLGDSDSIVQADAWDVTADYSVDLVLRHGSDAIGASILSWDLRSHGFVLLFRAYSRILNLVFELNTLSTPATVETCEGRFTYNADRRIYALTAPRHGRPPAVCTASDDE